MVPDLSHLAGQILLHVFPPDETAWTVFIGAFIQAVQLLPPFSNKGVQPHQFGFKVRFRSRFAVRCHESDDLL
jgi:hypothetical protein